MNIERLKEKKLMSPDDRKELSRNLLGLKKELEVNEGLRQVISNLDDISMIKERIVQAIKDYDDDRGYPLINENKLELFDFALEEVLEELSFLRKSEPSMYLVSTETGETIAPINQNQIFQPNSYVNSNGNEVVPQPIVNPGITASMVMKQSEDHKLKEATQGLSKYDSLAFEHLTDSRKILVKTVEKLKRNGVNAVIVKHPTKHLINFGKEHIEDVFQSPNLRFNRCEAYSSLLCNKFSSMVDLNDVIELGDIEKFKGSKFTEFRVGYNVIRAN